MTYPIPDSALDDRLAFIGTSGSGKTYNAGGAIERLLATGARCAIVDPLGVWWGLRLNADSTPSKHNVVIFGGEHGDLPLNENAGKIIGETVATMAESCIIDLSALNSKAAERRFMLAFLEAVYRNATRDPLHMPIDEADMFAPQRGSDEPRLQALMEQIVRRGRTRGFIPWLITQRPAVLSKDVLSQADGLVAFKLTASQDRKALGDWVKAQADEGQWNKIDAQLPTMQQGQGIVWLPSHGILETVAFPAKATFDSSRTPKRGERVERKKLKPLDLDQLKGKLAAIEDEAKASDPRALKAEVARLSRELAKATKAVTAPPPAERVIANADELANEREAGRRQGFSEGVDAAAQAIATLSGAPIRSAVHLKPGTRGSTSAPPIIERSPAPTGGPGQRILNALAWWNVLGHSSPLNEQVAFIAGYSHTSSGYTNPRGALKSSGLIDYPKPGCVALTEAGRDQAEAPDAAPTGEELRRRVLGKLAGPQQRILGVLIESYPAPLSNEECAAKAGYSHTSSGYTNPRGNLKTLNLIGYPSPGQARAADWLFP